MLCLRDIRKNYGGRTVLGGIGLSVESGEAVCVAGRNAQGKSTLLSIAAGLIRPDGGDVASDGEIGFVPQAPALLPELSVRDHLELWIAAHGRKKNRPFETGSPEVKLGLLEHASKRARSLSGGVQKRLSVCLALAGSPKTLILDEPFAALDRTGGEELEALLREFLASGGGILMTSHDPMRISAIGREVYLLEGGRFAAREVLTDEMSPKERRLRVLNLLSGCAGTEGEGTALEDR
ncbi:MAG TPA: ABC transporter ATP-binding protein [Candidatus Fimivivens faecavium]|nr:ABC transporter ATP-binding protein [Candidatus Fimivivens faecavium]